MVYRIRYQDTGRDCESEATVEANNPTEALVKFCHTREHVCDAQRLRRMVTSVCPDEPLEDLYRCRPG